MVRRTDGDTIAAISNSAALEDEIFLQMDKLLALCATQTALDFGDQQVPLGIRSHYSLLMEEHAQTLRAALVKRLG